MNQCEEAEDCRLWGGVNWGFLPLTFGRAGGQFRTRAGQKGPFLGSNKTLRGQCVYWRSLTFEEEARGFLLISHCQGEWGKG